MKIKRGDSVALKIFPSQTIGEVIGVRKAGKYWGKELDSKNPLMYIKCKDGTTAEYLQSALLKK